MELLAQAPPVLSSTAKEELLSSSQLDARLAVHYLKTYPQSIGITHHLIARLRELSPDEVEFYWPQLCYLLITRPTPSVALENLILERSEADSHVAVITLWFLQSSLSDLANNPTTPEFAICRRIFNQIQSLVYSDPPSPSPLAVEAPPSPAVAKFSRFSSRSKSQKVTNALPSFVGIGMMAASALGAPRLAQGAGIIAVEQGRKVIEAEHVQMGGEGNNSVSGSEDEDEDDAAAPPVPPKSAATRFAALPPTNGSLSPTKRKPTTKAKLNYIPGARLEATPPSPLPVPHSLTLHQTQSQPYLISSANSSPLASASSMRSTFPSSPHRSSTTTNPPRSTSSSFSVGSLITATLSSSNIGSSSMSKNGAKEKRQEIGGGLPKAFLSHLLRLQACRSQLDLLRSLQDISTRLVVVPKLARLSSLRAELTVLNHGLPRGCCLGLACTGSSFCSPSPSPSSDALTKSASSTTLPKSQAHARIVRISPSESVVLNSADRAPFVIHVEVLEGDLDFDPDRRQNAEDLRRALREREGGVGASSVSGGSGSAAAGLERREAGRREALGGGIGVGEGGGGREVNGLVNGVGGRTAERNPSMSNSVARPSSSIPGPVSTAHHSDNATLGSASRKPSIATTTTNSPALAEPEEMDLVEQLYGDISIRTPLPDGTRAPEERAIENRTVDEQAWSSNRPSRSTSPSHTTSGTSFGTLGAGLGGRRTSLGIPGQLPSSSSISKTSVNGTTNDGTTSNRTVFSLDDYASRMRMAAIMLSQLTASETFSKGVVATSATTAVQLVGLPVTVVTGLGGVVGGVVGAGLGAMLGSRMPFSGGNGRKVEQAGQGSSGVTVGLDLSSASEGTSDVSGIPSALPPLPSSLSSSTNKSTPQTTIPHERQRVLSPIEATAIRNRIMGEMMALEEERMERMRDDGRVRSGWTAGGGKAGVEDEAVVMRAVNKDDPSGAVFQESFADKVARIKAASPYGHLANWNVISVIVKTGADLRQEQLAIQLVKEFGRIWAEEGSDCWVRYFRILVTSESSGLIETITDAVSIHSIKKIAYSRTAADGTVFTSYSLYDYYVETFGPPTSTTFKRAQTAFIKSLAAYSVICYLLQLKDRHNGNILVDRKGHLIHIDFGFLLSNSPGSLGFEMAPFKLPQDYIEILGGFNSEKFIEFKGLFKSGFRDVRKYAERIVSLVELMQKGSNLPCFNNGDLTSQQLRERFQLGLTDAQVDDFVDKLVINSAMSTFTKLYDLFQYHSNGIL